MAAADITLWAVSKVPDLPSSKATENVGNVAGTLGITLGFSELMKQYSEEEKFLNLTIRNDLPYDLVDHNFYFQDTEVKREVEDGFVKRNRRVTTTTSQIEVAVEASHCVLKNSKESGEEQLYRVDGFPLRIAAGSLQKVAIKRPFEKFVITYRIKGTESRPALFCEPWWHDMIYGGGSFELRVIDASVSADQSLLQKGKITSGRASSSDRHGGLREFRYSPYLLQAMMGSVNPATLDVRITLENNWP